jgi:hypothetical protein
MFFFVVRGKLFRSSVVPATPASEAGLAPVTP